MSREKVEIVRDLYEAWNRTGGVAQWDSIHPDVEVEFTGGILKGKYRGHAGLSQALDSFWSSFENSRIDIESCRASGDDVVVTLRYIARGRASGVVVDAPGWHVWTVRRSKVMRWLIFGTRRDAFAAAGLSA